MTERPALDAWLADTEWVTTSDGTLSDDAVRCRPNSPTLIGFGREGQIAAPAHWTPIERPDGPTFAETAVALLDGMRRTVEQWNAATAQLNVAVSRGSAGLAILADEIRRQQAEDAANQEAAKQAVASLRAKFNPPPPPDLPPTSALPIRHGQLGVSCPRHGAMHGGICHRCRR